MKYPSYEEIEDYVYSLPKDSQRYAFFLSDYGHTNHERTKRIYYTMSVRERLDEKSEQSIKNIGWDIHYDGGIDAMRACYYMLRFALRVMNKDKEPTAKLSEDITSYTYTLSVLWHCVGDWRH